MDRKEYTKTVRIADMTCPLCEKRVSRALMTIEGVESARADYIHGTAVISSSRSISNEELETVLVKAGYSLAANTRLQELFKSIPVFLLAAGFLVISGIGGFSFFNFFPEAHEGLGLAAIFLVGIMTSVHCVSMCGGINLGQSVNAARSGIPVLRSNLDYQAGRLISYSMIGGIAGLLGNVVAVNIYIRGIIMAAAGACMLLMALNILGFLRPLRRVAAGTRLPVPVLSVISRAGKGRSSFVTGLLNGFMPCGPLQSMQIYALGTGSFVMGMLSMAVFCAGTVPLLLIVGLVGGSLNRSASRVMMRVSAALVIALGVIMIGNGLSLCGIAVPEPGFGPGAGTAGIIEASGADVDSEGYDGSAADDITGIVWDDADTSFGINGLNGSGYEVNERFGDVWETAGDGYGYGSGQLDKNVGNDPGAGEGEGTNADYGAGAGAGISADAGAGAGIGADADAGAGGGADDGAGSGTGAENGDDYGGGRRALVDGDVQTVSSGADYGSYEPIIVQKGIEVLWTLTVPEGRLIGCNNEIFVPEYGVSQKLSEGDNMITFIPEETGTYIFTCWMGMIRSTITVVEEI